MSTNDKRKVFSTDKVITLKYYKDRNDKKDPFERSFCIKKKIGDGASRIVYYVTYEEQGRKHCAVLKRFQPV